MANPALLCAEVELRKLLSAVVKTALVTEGAVTASWREEAVAAQHGLRETAGDPDLHREIARHLDGVWTKAVTEAEADASVRAGTKVQPTLQQTCLFSLEELLASDFDPDRAAETVTRSASTG